MTWSSGERSGERFGEVTDAAVIHAQCLAVVDARRTVERGHSPSDPKQAATHAALRIGRSHSTTEIIVCLPFSLTRCPGAVPTWVA
jgi:hypothetical protein